MVDQAGKGEGRKTGVAAKGRGRVAAKPPVAAKPVLPPVPAEPEVPAVLANTAPVADTPVEETVPVTPVVEAAPAPAVPTPVATTEPEPAPQPDPVPAPAPTIQPEPSASAAPFEVKETKMNETVTTFADKAQEQTRNAFANAGEQSRAAMEKSRKVAEDMAEFGKGNVEALVESARIAAQAIESMGQEAATFARTRYESTAQMIQTLASVKSPTEALQIQADYFRSSFDALVKEASRSTEATLKLAGDVAKPLQNRVAVAADKFRPAA